MNPFTWNTKLYVCVSVTTSSVYLLLVLKIKLTALKFLIRCHFDYFCGKRKNTFLSSSFSGRNVRLIANLRNLFFSELHLKCSVMIGPVKFVRI